jgi:hypothetical protein
MNEFAEEISAEVLDCIEFTEPADVPASWATDGAVGTVSIRCVFDNPSVDADLAIADQYATEPRARFKTSECAFAKEGDLFSVAGTTWRVASEPRPDGNGITDMLVMLEGSP